MYRKLPNSLQKIVKRIGRIEARIHKKLVCMQPRLMRRYGLLKYPEGISVRALKEEKLNLLTEFFDYVKNGNADDEEVEYIEDCFADMERPKFGYVVKLMLKEKERCEIDFENPERSTCNLPSNATREGLRRISS